MRKILISVVLLSSLILTGCGSEASCENNIITIYNKDNSIVRTIQGDVTIDIKDNNIEVTYWKINIIPEQTKSEIIQLEEGQRVEFQH